MPIHPPLFLSPSTYIRSNLQCPFKLTTSMSLGYERKPEHPTETIIKWEQANSTKAASNPVAGPVGSCNTCRGTNRVILILWNRYHSSLPFSCSGTWLMGSRKCVNPIKADGKWRQWRWVEAENKNKRGKRTNNGEIGLHIGWIASKSAWTNFPMGSTSV